MRRWVWRILLLIAVTAALAGTAAAADPVTLDSGIVLEADGNNWKITGYTGTGGRVVLPSAYDQKAITAIGDAAFKNTNGRKISEVVFPSTITSVGDNAFENCIGLKIVLFLPDSAGDVTIGKSAFSGTGVNTLVLPDKLVTIGESAFANNTSLTKVTIPDSVKTIEAKAFANDKNLKTVYIPEALKPTASGTTKPVSANAFANTLLESIHYGGSDKRDVQKYIFETMPPGVTNEEVHLATDSTHVNPPTCENDGQVMGGGFCQAASENQTAACKDLAGGEITINALGHDYQEPPNTDTEHAACATWEWEFEAMCSRCGETMSLKKTVVGTASHNFEDTDQGTVTTAATCTKKGVKTFQQECKPADGKKCGATQTRTEEIPLTKHTYTDKTEEYEIRPATCSEDPSRKNTIAVYKICDVCGILNGCEDCKTLKTALENAQKSMVGTDRTEVAAAEIALIEHLQANHGDESTDEYVEIKLPQRLEHTLPEQTEENMDHETPATCTQEGEWVYKDGTKCAVCGEELAGEALRVVLKKIPHVSATPSEKRTEPTCTEPGSVIKFAAVCEECGAKINEDEEDEVESIPPKGHTWGNFAEDAERVEPTCGKEGSVTGNVECTVCQHKENRTIPIPATGKHEYGDWETVKPPTETEAGSKKRVCKVCGYEDVEAIPATGSSQPEDPDKPTDPDTPTDPDKPVTYRVDLIQGSNGSMWSNKTAAASGDRITVTVRPNSGYELDMIRAITSGGTVVNLSDRYSDEYRFTMPASNVEVRATFVRQSSGNSYWGGANWASPPGDGEDSGARRTTDPMPTQNPTQSVPKAGASSQLFRDIPTYHWAAGEINWANQMGYMSGSGGSFNPDGTITHQQMWMVLARLTGSRPANMTEARRWAVENSFADGSSPNGAVTRQQLVTALYRCAHLMGSTNRNTTSLAGYTDSRLVPTVARDAFAWAVANGILGGTANGRLDPNGTLTRAQFAVILYRYSYRI